MDTNPPTSTCPDCVLLRAEVAALTAKLQELERKLNRNSSNSSKPPSSDPPWQRPPPASPTGRKPGGQRGHPGHFRVPLQPTSVQLYIPQHCAACGLALPQTAAPSDPQPIRHQVLELPEQPLAIVEHQSHARTCPGCGHCTRQPLPADITASVVGPRLAGALSWWVAKGHVARRFVVEILETVFKVPLSLGTVVACEAEVSAALAQPYAVIAAAVRAASSANLDETSWRCFRERPWVWVVATTRSVLYGIRPTRSAQEVKALLGNLLQARIVGSDRFGAYNGLPLECRQLCWAHLIRDFVRIGELADGAALSQVCLDTAKAVFTQWYAFRDGRLTRVQLQAQIQPLRDALFAQMQAHHRGSPNPQVRNFAGRIERPFAALWTFVEHEGVEPTNNEAERMLRTMVQWRKNSYGCHSTGGCQFAERIMSVLQTLRKQGRDVLSYLAAAIQAHRTATPPPAIIPA